jgi:SnoaL-like domain
MSDCDQIARRLDAIESRLEIAQLPVRFAAALDSRDLDAYVSLYVPDVKFQPGDRVGRDALKKTMSKRFRSFGRSIHLVSGHRIELDPDDPDRAAGSLYGRSEQEVGDRWIVMASIYSDKYRRVDGEWLFEDRAIDHWYATDINEHPQAVAYDSWWGGAASTLPGKFPTWEQFWDGQPPS